MTRRDPPIGRWIRWTVLFAVPALAAMVAIAVIEGLGPSRFLIAIGIALAISGIAGRLVAARMERLRRLIAQDDEDGSAFTKTGVWGIAGEIADVALRTRRSYGDRIETLERKATDAERIIESLPVPILFVGHDKQVVSANRAARTIVGEKPVGRTLSTVTRDPGVLDAADSVLAGSEGAEVELSIIDALTRHFLAQVLPIRAPEGDGTAIIIALQDLTAAKRIDQTRSDFIANVSHELRTPLSSLIGFIETLQGPARDDTAARERFLVLMQEQTARMLRLIGDLMSLSRIELHEHSRPSGRVDVASAAQRVVEVMQIRAKQKSVGLRLEMPDRPAPAIGEDDEIMQVIQNLVDNAVKYSPEGSKVTVAVRHDKPATGGEAVTIAVRDEGEGIAPEHLPRLTERFYRVDAARSRALGGTGLGLAIVKHIVNRHGGRLEIESSPGEGSSFAVSLPAAPVKTSARNR